jgi:hypothetical protein
MTSILGNKEMVRPAKVPMRDLFPYQTHQTQDSIQSSCEIHECTPTDAKKFENTNCPPTSEDIHSIVITPAMLPVMWDPSRKPQ